MQIILGCIAKQVVNLLNKDENDKGYMENDNLINIVYIEDDPEMVDLVSLVLSTKGIKVTGANTGQQGISFIKDLNPDLILLDIMIPDLDGWDIFQILKNDPATDRIPIIIVTAKSQPIDRVLGLHIAGVDDYITKPFLPQQLFDSINKVILSRK